MLPPEGFRRVTHKHVMGKNLAKAPLIGVFYAALIWFAAVFPPRSEGYIAASEGFAMPMTGMLILLGYAALAAAVYAVAFSGTQHGGVVFTVMLTASVCGLQWVVPKLRQILLGEATGSMTMTDTLFQLAGNCGAAVLTLVLASLLYSTYGGPLKKNRRQSDKPDAAPPVEAKYKLGVVALITRLFALPIIYFIFYYVAWYFLFWRKESVYTFYTGAELSALENFMGELIHVLVDRGMEAVLTLLTGLAYAVFSFPLAIRMRGKRALFIIANTMLYILGAVHFLIPDPLLPDEVRMAQLIMNGAVLFVYGALSGLLLVTVFRKTEAPAANEEKPAKPSKKKSKKGQEEEPEATEKEEKTEKAAASKKK